MAINTNRLSALAFLALVAGVGDSHAQPVRAWRAPVDASIAGCYEAKAQAALMDDGSLLVVCVANFSVSRYNNAPLWQRARDGAWRIAAQPPTRTSRATGLRKLAGDTALVTWSDFVPEAPYIRTTLQVWNSGAGAAPAFQIPSPPGEAGLDPLPDSWGLDERAVRIRTSRVGEVPIPPGSPATPLASVIELVDRAGQAIGPTLPIPGRAIRGVSAACQFPNGDRLIAITSFETKALPTPIPDIDVQAVFHRRGGGWEGPFSLFQVAGLLGQSSRAFCPANGIAKIVSGFGAPQKLYFADLAGGDGWRPVQQLNSDDSAADDKSSAAAVLYAQSNDGRAAVAWNDQQPSPAGFTGQPGHKSIPRVQWIDSGARYFTFDFKMPRYDPDSPEDTAVNAVAWDPKRERFIFVLTGGPGPSPRRALAELSPAGSWSAATALPGPFLRGWQLDFNAAGDGVLLGQRHGQLLISDWR